MISIIDITISTIFIFSLVAGVCQAQEELHDACWGEFNMAFGEAKMISSGKLNY
jgi:hypothetical protein